MADIISLPKPSLKGPLSLEETLLQRRSRRQFTSDPLTMDQVSQLLWAAQGITNERGFRTAPSAGALYPLEIYILSQDGIFHYQPGANALVQHREGDFRRDVYEVALRQDAIIQAPMTVVITAVYARTSWKYGPARTPRYVHMEVGHAAQNLLLQAVSLGLGAVPIGAFEDNKVQTVLGLPEDHEPLYLIPVGYTE
ncbi:MAG: SagB/ThcOx family dehydrogenase [Anaerolineales bacterium]|nr:SagB/ThcOx family dehydrogenase [Anaerolineales bacterium]